ncbi:ABC transporter ATP-binding protein [Aerobium aerolatum]|uniref:Peptide/nickel transport system ATP-binding protein n=1 Tax=Aquamicrobium aerolatum DSM 21857 TaxID=1121003 RepID=A0A1I3IFW3_9HYPH|nr:oligopeptide/dipeptide ABC transporter ATP-binding protein [Aquamicrobium aerolatum]SFI46816.1 peptide/nickel transport system ATP-binding protein [Aquamicrobium aerolatum DSM 21857]
MTTPLLEARDLNHVYFLRHGFLKQPAPLRALNGVSLTINEGEILGIVGESGCGKSTLARILLGLETPTSGDVILEGRPVSSYPQRERALAVQPVFQDPYGSLNPSMSVEDLIALPLHVHKIGSRQERQQKVARMAEQVGLPRRALSASPNQLSGGQRQRVAIARALVSGPRLVICDEPTSALDVSVQAQILNLLLDLRAEHRVAMLFISHNLSVIEHMADRMMVMYLGRVVEAGSTQQIFAAPAHPYTAVLRDSVFSPDDDGGVPDLGLRGNFPNAMNMPSGCVFHPRCPVARPECATTEPFLTQAHDASRQNACLFPLN